MSLRRSTVAASKMKSPRDIRSIEEEVEKGWLLDKDDVVMEPAPFAWGNFGRVHRGVYYGRPVCVKQIKVNRANLDDVKQIENEVFALKSLTHPNLLQFIGMMKDDDDGKMMLVTEYIPGGTARSALKKEKGDISWDVRLQMAYDIASAIAFLHKQKVIHRDIKSENILVTENHHVKLCDFGFARKVVDAKRAQYMTLCGTDDFMAPEVTLGMDYDAAADIFSYGLFLVELIIREKVEEVLPRGPQNCFCLPVDDFLAMVPTETPKAIVDIAVQCCDYEPSKRPDANTLVSLLDGVSSAISSPIQKSSSGGMRQKVINKLRRSVSKGDRGSICTSQLTPLASSPSLGTFNLQTFSHSPPTGV